MQETPNKAHRVDRLIAVTRSTTAATAFRSLGNDGARANAERALTASAANRAAVDKLVARLASTRSRSA